jgi:uncharacterized protein (DUF849 family)
MSTANMVGEGPDPGAWDYGRERVAKQKNTIITCAVTGAGLTPSMSPYLPYTAEDMIKQSVDAAKAGASVLHLHARDPKNGQPTNAVEVWESFVPGIRKGCEAVINMSASLGATAEESANSNTIGNGNCSDRKRMSKSLRTHSRRSAG